jgi:serine protease Do/serine protease DegQ
MLKRVMPAVVNISTSGTRNIATNPLLQDPFFRRFFDFPERPRERRTQSLGSGVIIDAGEGIVVTNSHVIEKAEMISVTLQDGRNFEARLIGTDPDTDIAVVKIEPEELVDVPLGDSDVLEVGDFVVAIGNPFGLNQTVTSGIVSALGRDGLGIEGYEDFIQTDASINPGNSGGALVNLKGELIGINTAILAPAGGNVGIGFAIPINMTSQIAEQLISHGRVKRGRLGVYVQDLTPDLAQAFGTGRSQGALIAQIIPKSPAEKSGLREGDLVISINSRRIDDAADLLNAIGLLRVGQELELRVIRGGEERTIEAHIDEAEETLHEGKTLHRSLSGVLFLESEAGSGTEGVLVETVEKRSRAWNAGLRAGDLIVGVNRYRVRTLDDFSSVASGSDGLRIEFLRDGSAYYLTID